MSNFSADEMDVSVQHEQPGVPGSVGIEHSGSKLRRNIAALSVLQLLNYALPLAVLPYLGRILGPAHYGLLVFGQATLNYANSITDYGFNFSATRLVARNRDDKFEISRIFWSTMAAKCVLMAASFLVLSVLILAVPRFRENAGLLAACSILVVGTVLFPQWFFQGMEEMRAITIAQSGAKLLVIPLIFLFVHSQEHYVRAAAIQAGTNLLAGLISIPLMLRITPIRWYRPRWADILNSYREGWHVFISQAAIFVYTSTNTLILTFISGDVQVGYFGAGDKIIKASNAVTVPLTQALYPRLNSLAVKSKDAAVSLIRKSIIWISIITASVSLVILFGAPVISRILFGPKFDGSITPLRWMAFLPVLLGLSNVFGVQTMLTFGLNKEYNRIVSGSAAINLLLTLPFAKIWGAAGAGVAILITEIVVTAAMYWQVRSAGLLDSTSDSRSEQL